MLGVDPADGTRAWRDRIGIVLQESAPDPGLTVRESLELYAGYYSNPRSVPETIALVGLAGKNDQQATSLSGGERRRLDFGLALIGDPELIFLDEPTTGFDPSARRAAWDVIENLRDLGKTIFLTTHYMDEAERLADRIAVIVAGQIVAHGTPLTLGGRDQAPSTIAFTLRPRRSLDGAPRQPPRGRRDTRRRRRRAVQRYPTRAPRSPRRMGTDKRRRTREPRSHTTDPRRHLPDADTHHERGRPPMTPFRLDPLSLRRHLRRARRSTGSRSAARLVLHQTRFDLRSFSRDKQARFTTLALPVVLLVAFVSVGGGNKTFVQDGHTITTAVFFVPGLIALAVISASFSNLLTDLVAQRDSGILKRRRATPVPAYALIGGRTLTAAAISLVTASLLLLAGGNVYDITIPNHALPAVAITIILGSVTFSALAYASRRRSTPQPPSNPSSRWSSSPSTRSRACCFPTPRTPTGSTTSPAPCRSNTSPTHSTTPSTPPPTDSGSAPSTSPSSPHGHSPRSPSPPHASAGYHTPTSQPELRGSAHPSPRRSGHDAIASSTTARMPTRQRSRRSS